MAAEVLDENKVKLVYMIALFDDAKNKRRYAMEYNSFREGDF